MMNLLKKCIHSFLGLPGTLDSTTTDNFHLNSRHYISSLSGGLGLIAAAKDVNRLPNVLESAAVKPTPPPSKREIGFIRGQVHGLTSCTESLGFESSDERRVDDQIEEINHDKDDGICLRWTGANARKVGYEKKVKSFPPPLSSFNLKGQPIFFLRPVRKNGRLELTEVRIHRPETLHASRQDGRLRLHLIPDEIEEEEEEELEEVEVEEEIVEAGEEVEEVEDSGYEREAEDWKLGIRRCHEVVNQHNHVHGGQHHHLQIC